MSSPSSSASVDLEAANASATVVTATATVVGAAPPTAASDAPAVTCVSLAIPSKEEWRQRHAVDIAAAGPSDDSVIFRPLAHADLPSVIELHRSLFPVQYTDTFFQKLFTAGYYCLVGVDRDGEIVTVASARTVDQLDPTATPVPEAYIMTLGVRPSHRRRGLGARQMEQMLRLLRAKTRCTTVALHVKAANRAACAFYDELGFKCDLEYGGMLPNHYFLEGQYWDARKYTRPLIGPFGALWRDLVEDGCAVL